MSIEEQLDWLCRLRSEVKIYMPIEWVDHFEDALTESINKLSQEPCDDAISRDAVLNAICDYVAFEEYEDKSHTFTVKPLEKRIDALPSVTPSRHVNCEIAEHDGNGCLGYSHYGDDFPVEECLHCSKYTSYEEE